MENGRLHFGAEALGIASPLEMSSLVAERTGEPPMGTGSPATEGGADQGPTLSLQLGSEEEGAPSRAQPGWSLQRKAWFGTVPALSHTLPVSNREASGS